MKVIITCTMKIITCTMKVITSTMKVITCTMKVVTCTITIMVIFKCLPSNRTLAFILNNPTAKRVSVTALCQPHPSTCLDSSILLIGSNTSIEYAPLNTERKAGRL